MSNEHVKRVSERTRLKAVARYLKGQIRKARSLLRQQAQVAKLRQDLEELEKNIWPAGDPRR